MSEDHIDDTAAPLIEHLAELRTRLVWSVLAFLVAMCACFFVAQPIMDFLVHPIAEVMRQRGENPQLIFTAPQEKFFVLVRISIIAGLGLSFPVIAYQMWRFVAPGLYKSEKNAFLPFIVASPLLFLAGAAFAQFVVTPMAMRFFIGFSDAIPTLASVLTNGSHIDGGAAPVPDSTPLSTVFLGSVKESLDLSLKFIFAFGLCFQLPVLLTLMAKAGLINAKALSTTRRYAVVGILVLAAILTPPDVMSQLLLFSVVYGLYEISILLVRRVDRQRERRMKAEGTWDEEIDGDGRAAD